MEAQSQEDAVCYLLKDKYRIDVLTQWFPKDGRSRFEPFTRQIIPWADVQVSNFARAARLLIQSERVIKAVANPVAQAVLQEWHALHSSAKESGLQTSFLDEIMSELGQIKLGLARSCAPAKKAEDIAIPLPDMHIDFAKALSKSLSSLYKKWAELEVEEFPALNSFAHTLKAKLEAEGDQFLFDLNMIWKVRGTLLFASGQCLAHRLSPLSLVGKQFLVFMIFGKVSKYRDKAIHFLHFCNANEHGRFSFQIKQRSHALTRSPNKTCSLIEQLVAP